MEVLKHQVTDRFAQEIKTKTDELTKETQKAARLDDVIATLQRTTSSAQMEANKLKQENKTLNEKYNLQSTQHSSAFTVRIIESEIFAR